MEDVSQPFIDITESVNNTESNGFIFIIMSIVFVL